eukprot:6188578-Lingulodinium_polyedra.AAC.1
MGNACNDVALEMHFRVPGCPKIRSPPSQSPRLQPTAPGPTRTSQSRARIPHTSKYHIFC